MNGLGHLPNPLLLKWMNLQRFGSRGPNRVRVQPMCGPASFWHCCLDSAERAPMLAKRLAPVGVPPTRHSCVRQRRNWQLCWVLTEWWTSVVDLPSELGRINSATKPRKRSNSSFTEDSTTVGGQTSRAASARSRSNRASPSRTSSCATSNSLPCHRFSLRFCPPRGTQWWT